MEKRKKNKCIPFRMTEADYKIIKCKAEKAGVSMQKYLSISARCSVVLSQEFTDVLKGISASMMDADRQLKGIAVNMNQIAHLANEMGETVSASQIKKVADEVTENRKEQNNNWQYLRSLIEMRVPPMEE